MEAQLTSCKIVLNSNHRISITVDEDDVARIQARRWRLILRNGLETIVTSVRGQHGPRNVSLARFLLDTQLPRNCCVISTAQRDFRKTCLKVITLSQKRQRAKKIADTSSRFKGVSKVSGQKLWRVQVEFCGVAVYVGTFTCEHAAARAYNDSARRFYGESAWINEGI